MLTAPHKTQVKLTLREMADEPHWLSPRDGDKVFVKITEAFAAGHRVEVSFAGCHAQIGILVFLGTAIGGLYNGDYSEEFLLDHLSFSGMDDQMKQEVDAAIYGAKRYYADPEASDRAWEEVMGPIDEDDLVDEE